jgi:hypothetical protein
MIVEAIIAIIVIGALMITAPSIMGMIGGASPVNATANPLLGASQTTITTIFSGGLSIAGIAIFGLAVFVIGGTLMLRGE